MRLECTVCAHSGGRQELTHEKDGGRKTETKNRLKLKRVCYSEGGLKVILGLQI